MTPTVIGVQTVLTFLRKDVKSFVQGMWCCPWRHLFVLICSFKYVINFFAPTHPPPPFNIYWIYIVIVYVNLSSTFTLLVKLSGVNNAHDSISVSYWKLFCFVPWTFVCLLSFFYQGTESSGPFVSSRLATQREDAGGSGGARLNHRPSPFKVGTNVLNV